MIHSYSKYSACTLQDIFKNHDTDGSGTMSSHEMRAALTQAGKPICYPHLFPKAPDTPSRWSAVCNFLSDIFSTRSSYITQPLVVSQCCENGKEMLLCLWFCMESYFPSPKHRMYVLVGRWL